MEVFTSKHQPTPKYQLGLLTQGCERPCVDSQAVTPPSCLTGRVDQVKAAQKQEPTPSIWPGGQAGVCRGPGRFCLLCRAQPVDRQPWNKAGWAGGQLFISFSALMQPGTLPCLCRWQPKRTGLPLLAFLHPTPPISAYLCQYVEHSSCAWLA